MQNYVTDNWSQFKLIPLMNLIYRHKIINKTAKIKTQKDNICGRLKIFVVSVTKDRGWCLYIWLYSLDLMLFSDSGCWGRWWSYFQWCYFLLTLLVKTPSELIDVCVLKMDTQFFITAFTNGMSMIDAPLSLTSSNVWPVQIIVLSIIWQSHHCHI